MHITESPLESLSNIELFARLQRLLDPLRPTNVATKEFKLGNIYHEHDFDTWLTYQFIAAFNDHAAVVVGDQLTLSRLIEFKAGLVMDTLNPDEGSWTTLENGDQVMTLPPLFAELRRRFEADALPEIRNGNQLANKALACVWEDNDELLGRLLKALNVIAGAFDQELLTELDLTRLDDDGRGWLIRCINRATGRSSKLPRTAVRIEGLIEEQLAIVHQQLGEYYMLPVNGRFELANWVRIIGTRYTRDELPQAFAA